LEDLPLNGSDSAPGNIRVCSTCGRQPGAGIHCQHCGVNLLWRRKLPTRRQWMQGAAKNDDSSAPRGKGRLRYLPGDLKELHLGPGEIERGRLMLVLALNEILEADEPVTRIASAAKLGVSWSLVITPRRLHCVPGGSVVFFERSWLRTFDLSAIGSFQHRRALHRSYLSFRSEVYGGTWFSMKGRNTACLLVEILTDPTLRRADSLLDPTDPAREISLDRGKPHR